MATVTPAIFGAPPDVVGGKNPIEAGKKLCHEPENMSLATTRLNVCQPFTVNPQNSPIGSYYNSTNFTSKITSEAQIATCPKSPGL